MVLEVTGGAIIGKDRPLGERKAGRETEKWRGNRRGGGGRRDAGDEGGEKGDRQ